MKIFMKVIVIGFLVTFFTQNCFADNYDFRKAKWGMSMAQVKASESLSIKNKDKDKDVLIYKTKILNNNVALVYSFINDKLVSGHYVVEEKHSNKNDYIADYKDFKKILTKKYGKPKMDRTMWKDDLYKSDVSSWGMAVSIGHLVYGSSWETDETKINDTLLGDNYQISLIIAYVSKKFKALKEEARTKEALDVL